MMTIVLSFSVQDAVCMLNVFALAVS